MKRSKVFLALLAVLNLRFIQSAVVGNDVEKVQLNIAIIGAGPSGLFSARHSLARGHQVTVYEQNEEIGGVWAYTNETGINKYGVNIHTAMYKGLRYVHL